MPRTKQAKTQKHVPTPEEDYDESEEEIEDVGLPVLAQYDEDHISALYTATLSSEFTGEEEMGEDLEEVDDYDPTEDTSSEEEENDGDQTDDDDYVPDAPPAKKKKVTPRGSSQSPVKVARLSLSPVAHSSIPAASPDDMFKNIAMKALQNVSTGASSGGGGFPMGPGGMGIGTGRGRGLGGMSRMDLNAGILDHKYGPGRIASAGPGRKSGAMTVNPTKMGPGRINTGANPTNINIGNIVKNVVKTGPGRIDSSNMGANKINIGNIVKNVIKTGPGRIDLSNAAQMIQSSPGKSSGKTGPGRLDLSNAMSVKSGPGRVNVNTSGRGKVVTGPGRVDLSTFQKTSGPGRIKTGMSRIDLSAAMTDVVGTSKPATNVAVPIAKPVVIQPESDDDTEDSNSNSMPGIIVKQEPAFGNDDLADTINAIAQFESAQTQASKLSWSEMPQIRPSVQKDKGTPYSCEICQKNFKSKSSYYIHLRKQYQCEVCKEKFHTRELCIIHRFQIHKIKCERKVASENKDTKFLIRSYGKIASDDEQDTESVPDAVAKRRKRGRPRKEDEIGMSSLKEFEDIVRQKQTTAAEILKQGQEAAESLEEEESAPQEESENKHGVNTYYNCDLCGNIYLDPGKLEWHKRRNHPTSYTLRTFLCDVCDTRFFTNEEFKMHIAITGHTKPKKGQHPYVCNICFYTFPTRVHLQTHVQNHLPAEINNCCNICGYRVPEGMESTLIKHFEEEHTNAKKPTLTVEKFNPPKAATPTKGKGKGRGRPKGAKGKAKGGRKR